MSRQMMNLDHHIKVVQIGNIQIETHAQTMDPLAAGNDHCAIDSVSLEQSTTFCAPTVGYLGRRQHTSCAHEPSHNISLTDRGVLTESRS